MKKLKDRYEVNEFGLEKWAYMNGILSKYFAIERVHDALIDGCFNGRANDIWDFVREFWGWDGGTIHQVEREVIRIKIGGIIK